jgi:integrase
MGQVRITKAGYLYFDFFYEGVRCREYTELKNTTENMKIMNEAMRKIESEIQLGTFIYEKYFPGGRNAQKFSKEEKGHAEITFGEYAKKWYRNNKIEWKPSVRRDFSSIMECHLIPYFRDRAVAEITKSMIKEFRTSLSELKGRKGKNLSNKRINNILSVMRLIMNEATEEFDFTSPFADLKPLSVRKPEIMPFSLQEVFIFLGVVTKSFYNYYVIRFFTGMRTAEIDGLKWQYVDFVNKKIMVRETWQNGQWVGPKTESSVRDIDMSKIVEDALLDQKQLTGDSELVFCTKKRKPLDYSNISKRIWYPTLKKAGLASRNPYQTRHTAATLWLASGENPEWIAKQLGHSDTQMLFKIYSKFIPNLTRKDGSAFERFLDQKLTEYKEEGDTKEKGDGA